MSSKRREESSLAFGGQAVLEGIMIRSQKYMVVCIRKQNGEILTKKVKIHSLNEKYRLFKLPFIRGIIALFETLYLGTKGLFLSANTILEESGEKLTRKEVAITIIMTLALMSFFIVIPFMLTNLFTTQGIVFNVAESVIRLTIFLFYIKLVSMWEEFNRLLKYHGAEHKAINTFEAGVALNLENAKKHSRLHPRCGTSFIFIVALVSILLFSIMPDLGVFLRLAYRLILIPVIGALSYELLKFSDQHRSSKIMRILIMPGLGLQHLTTKEPDDEMINVALNAVKVMNLRINP